MKIPFVKMHGAGNDFVMLNGIEGSLPKDLSSFSKQICHRQFGVGADQVLIAFQSDKADFRMDIFNADGGQVEMCGNGIRCFVQYLRDLKLTSKAQIDVETLAGIIRPEVILDHPKTTENMVWVKVDMGEPELEGAKVPVRQVGRVVDFPFKLTDVIGLGDIATGRLGDDSQSRKVAKSQSLDFKITCVSMGNPHCVIFVEDVKNFPVTTLGPLIEHDSFFPNRVNVEFVQVVNRHKLIQRTWERGSGETFACGTGACAVGVAAVLTGQAEREMKISLKGGDLEIVWDEKTNHVFKTGPATTVFSGEYIW